MSTSVADIYVQIGVNGLSSVASALGAVKNYLGSVGAAASSMLSNLAGGGGVIGGLATGLQGVIGVGRGFLTMLSSILPLLRAVAPAALAVGSALYSGLNVALAGLPSKLVQMVGMVRPALFKLLSSLGPMVGSALQAVAPYVGVLGSVIASGIAKGQQLKALAASLGSAFVSQLANKIAGMAGAMSNAWQAVRQGAASAGAATVNAFATQFQILDARLGGALSAVGRHAAITAAVIKTQFQQAFSQVSAQLPAVLSALGPVGAGAQQVLNGIKTAATGAGSAISTALGPAAATAFNRVVAGAGQARAALNSVAAAAGPIARLLNPINVVAFGLRGILAPAARAAASAVGSIWTMAMGPLGLLWRAVNSIAGAMGLIVGAAGAFTLGKGIAEVASDAEQAHVAFTTMLGSAEKAKEMLAQVQDLADNTVLQLPEVRKGARTLVAMNIAAQDVVPTLRMLGDIAQGIQIPLNDLALIYGKIRQQNRVMGDDFRQFGDRGIPVVRELAKEMGLSTQQVYKMGSEGKIQFADLERVFKRLTSEGGQFHDMMGRMSQTLGGRWSTLMDTVKRIGIQIGTILLPSMKSIVDAAINFSQEFMRSGKAASVANTLAYAMNEIGKAIPPIIASVSEAWPVVAQFARMTWALGSAAFEALSMVAQAVNNLLPGVGSLGQNLLFAFETGQFMAENWQTLFLMMVEEVKLFASNASKTIVSFFTYGGELLTWFGKSWKDVMLTTADIVLGIMENLGKNIRAVWSATMEFVQGKGFKPDLTPMLDGVKQAIDRLLMSMPKMTRAILDQTTPELEQLKKELAGAWDEFEKRKHARENFKAEAQGAAAGGAAAQQAANMEMATGGKEKSPSYVGLAEYYKSIQQSVSPQERKMENFAREQLALTRKMVNEGIKVTNLGTQGSVFA